MEHLVQQKLVYKADVQLMETLKLIRERIHAAAGLCMHRPVRIQTVDGQIYEGKLVRIDGHHLYLAVNESTNPQRAFFPYYYGGFILPLVLFDLLAITLLW